MKPLNLVYQIWIQRADNTRLLEKKDTNMGGHIIL